MIGMSSITLLREAVATTALENGWDKDKQEEIFLALLQLIKDNNE